MKQVVVQLAPDAAPAQDGNQHQAAFEKAKDFGSTLKAIHPQSDDPALSRWYTAQVDNAKATELVETLRNIPEVTAAFVKPRAAMP